MTNGSTSGQAPQKRLSTPRPKDQGSREVWLWYFMRISGLVLVILALLHFAITHIIYDVAETDASFVEGRWANPLWRLYDWTLLVLAFGHGANGMRYLIDDYVRSAAVRRLIKIVTFGLIATAVAFGTLTVLTF